TELYACGLLFDIEFGSWRGGAVAQPCRGRHEGGCGVNSAEHGIRDSGGIALQLGEVEVDIARSAGLGAREKNFVDDFRRGTVGGEHCQRVSRPEMPVFPILLSPPLEQRWKALIRRAD